MLPGYFLPSVKATQPVRLVRSPLCQFGSVGGEQLLKRWFFVRFHRAEEIVLEALDKLELEKRWHPRQSLFKLRGEEAIAVPLDLPFFIILTLEVRAFHGPRRDRGSHTEYFGFAVESDTGHGARGIVKHL